MRTQKEWVKRRIRYLRKERERIAKKGLTTTKALTRIVANGGKLRAYNEMLDRILVEERNHDLV